MASPSVNEVKVMPAKKNHPGTYKILVGNWVAQGGIQSTKKRDLEISRSGGGRLNQGLEFFTFTLTACLQWDSMYRAWFYYNAKTDYSTWEKPKELVHVSLNPPKGISYFGLK